MGKPVKPKNVKYGSNARKEVGSDQSSVTRNLVIILMDGFSMLSLSAIVEPLHFLE